jgi:uncharacterized protein (UPF0276 family)
MRWLGGGIGHRRRYHDRLLAASADEQPAVLEIMPSHFLADPQRLAPLAERYPIVFHDVGLSLGTVPGGDDTTWARAGRLRELCALARPRLVSDHLALTRSPGGIEVGHLLPIPRTAESLAVVAAAVSRLQDRLRLPVALENIAAPFELAGAELSEPELLGELTRRTGCGLLLDLSNLLVNARNHGFDAARRLAEYPLESVWAVHLAGARRQGEMWVDSHDAPVEAAAQALLAPLRGRAPLATIVVERDHRLPPLGELVAESRSIARSWEES